MLWKRNLRKGLLLLAFALIPQISFADAIENEFNYGREMLTVQEREAYVARMRAAATAEERQQIRFEHRQMVLERAKAKGVVLPEQPMQQRMGVGNNKMKNPEKANRGSSSGQGGKGGKGQGGGGK